MHCDRREFIRTGVSAGVGAALAGCVTGAGGKGPRVWRKGQLHAHTIWSDGQALPEEALAVYRARGFDFVCLSDHDQFPTATDHWISVEKKFGEWPYHLAEEALQRAEKLAPGSIRVRNVWCRRYVRLKPFAELARQFNEPGKFLVVPGQEVSRSCHMNVFNIDAKLEDELTDLTGKDISRANVTKVARRIREVYLRHARPNGCSFLMMNHPYWLTWDVDPRVMLDVPELQVWEICNNGSEEAPRELDIEKAWDFVLAHRLANGGRLVYGTATDDAHSYEVSRRHTNCGTEGGWVVVDCPGELTADNLSQAILRGDFYATCGVEIEDFSFDDMTRTLSVRARPRANEKLRIEFITTKRGFDRSIVEQHVRAVQKEELFRDLPKVNDTIGRVVKTVEGPVGSYTLADDDLYARAVVISDRPTVNRTAHYPKTQRAWIQPVRGV